MCGIVGIAGFTPVNQSIYDALMGVQHRGQDAAGMLPLMPIMGSVCGKRTAW